MTRRALLVALVAIAPACGPEPVATAELGEVCGAPSPFRVLELEPDEVLKYNHPLRVGGRVLYVVSRRGEDDPDFPFPVTTDTTVWSTGPCGESPRRLATGVDLLFTLDIWPDVVLGCDSEAGQVVVLDPTGVNAPHVAFPDVSARFGCALRWTPHGVLTVDEYDENLGALRLHPYPADPRSETSTPLVLLDPIRLGPSRSSGTGKIGEVLHTFQEFVLALTPDDTLVRVDLADGLVTPLQTNVAEFEASRAGRYVLWQDTTVIRDDLKYPEGKIFLTDLSTGSSTLLHETSLAFSPFPMQWADEGLLQLHLGRTAPNTKRMYFLPGLDYVDAHAELFLNGKLDDDRWLTSSLWRPGYDIIDLRRGERIPLFEGHADYVYRDADALEMVEVPPCCITGTFRDEGPIWRVPFDGSPPEQLARRATRHVDRLPDGRYLTPLDLDAGWLGPLVIIDPDTQAELRVDDRVFAFSVDPTRVDDDGVITYSVSDGDRSGVYLAKLPSGESTRAGSRPATPQSTFTVDLIPGRDGRPTPHLRALGDPPPHP